MPGPGRPFQSGHPHRWPPGVSGNPSGKPKGLIAFENKYALALANEGTPEELAKMIWSAARKGEAWAVLKLASMFEWRAETADRGQETITVVYVKADSVITSGVAPGSDASGSGGAEVQRLLLGPEGGQDGPGCGPGDTDSAGEAADGVVLPEL